MGHEKPFKNVCQRTFFSKSVTSKLKETIEIRYCTLSMWKTYWKYQKRNKKTNLRVFKVIRNMVLLLMQRVSSMGFVSLSSSLLVVVIFVDRNPLRIFLLWPLCVSFDSGQCLSTALAVRPGQDTNCFFLIAFSHAGLVRKLATAWW